MLFWKKKTPPLVQSSASAWREQWRAIVPPECRNVPITVDGRTVTAYVQINHFAMMLQDGLLMEEHFFDVCSHFQRAGYHVVWLMRCTQDIENGYLKLKKQRGDKCLWKWRKPTTNFGRWTSDNRCVTILLQYKSAPDGRSKTAPTKFCSASNGRKARTTPKWCPRARNLPPSAYPARRPTSPAGCAAASCRAICKLFPALAAFRATTPFMLSKHEPPPQAGVLFLSKKENET